MISTTGKQKPQPSAASHNLFKPSPNPARWSGSSCRRERLSNQVVVFRSPADPPQCPECCANPRLLCRGTNGSNPSPSSGESANFRYLSGTTCARGAGARDGTFGGGGRRVGGVPDSCRVLLGIGAEYASS